MTAAPDHDRGAEDVGNIIALEHVNVTVPDQRLAALFYLVGMGFTRDPYLMVGDENMWVNLGREQFHLPMRAPQVLRGHVGIVVPDLGALEQRLAGVRRKLADTRFSFREEDGCLAVTCPWGNQLRCHAPQPRFGAMSLGMPYVEFGVKRGAAAGIARFYEQMFGVKAALSRDGGCVTVSIGSDQWLVFREGDTPLPYDGHHIAVYVADFSGPRRRLRERGLVTEESNQHQYRCRDIVDPASGAVLFEVEHEVRSLKHPLWGRVLVNRNPAQTQRNYQRGRDAFSG
jgi:hypothetical protein